MQLVGAGKSKNGRKNIRAKKSRPNVLSPVFRLFPAPTNCPWVSEDTPPGERSEKGYGDENRVFPLDISDLYEPIPRPSPYYVTTYVIFGVKRECTEPIELKVN